MSSAILNYETASGVEDTLQYRAIHTGAIVGLVLAVVLAVFTIISAGNSAEACLMVSALNALPLGICLWSLGRIRRARDLYTGLPLAAIGAVISAASLVGGSLFGSYVYATEVPDGYARISFGTMKPDETQVRGDVKVPPEILALDGKKIFIKGYIRPDSIPVSKGIDRFLLVRDNNQCCFGSLADIKYYDQIEVDMTGSRRLDYRQGIFKMGGILRVQPENLVKGPTAPVFSLQADYAN
jgi:hypothetical protein